MALRIEKTVAVAVIHALTQAAYAEYGHEPGTSTALKETEEAIAAQLAAGTEALVVNLSPIPRRAGDGGWACVRYQIEDDALYFHRLAVHPEHRRQGLATALVQHLEALARARGLARLTCSVRLQVTDNVALYTGLGFTLVRERSLCRDGTAVPTGDLEKRLG